MSPIWYWVSPIWSDLVIRVTGPPDYQLWFMTCIREEEDRITYRHVPQDRIDSGPVALCGPVACTFCSDPGGLLHFVQQGEDWAGPQPAQAPPR